MIDDMNVLSSLIRTRGQKAVATTSAPSPALYDPGTARHQRISNRSARQHSQAYGGDEAIGAVMDCVDFYAQTASSAAYHFCRDGTVLQTPGEAEIPGAEGEAPADLARLFDTPNRTQQYTDLIELSVIDFLLTGEFFWFLNGVDGGGKPVELFRVSPALMEVVPGKVAPKGYVYNTPGGEPLELRPDEVVHVKRPNPHDPWRGLGVIAGDPRMYDIALAATASMADYYERGTRLSGVLESERTIPPNSFAKLKAEWPAIYSGKGNHHKVAILERGLKFRPLSGNARDSGYKEADDLTYERICKMFKIPPPLLGAVGSTDRQAVREAQRIFDNKIMRPFLNRLQRQVTEQLVSAWDLEWEIEYEFILPQEDKLDLAQALAALPGVRVREVRDLVDLEPLAAEDPELEWIDEAILNLPGGNLDENGQGGHADEPLSSEGGRPPAKQNTVLFPRKPGDLPKSSDIVTSEAAQKAVADALAKVA